MLLSHVNLAAAILPDSVATLCVVTSEMKKKKSTPIGVFGRPRIDRGVPFLLPITMLCHHVCRETINITKRILLRGSGGLGDTKLDQRANCPTFRLGRSAVIMHVEVDMTGFREAILITGTDRVCPVLQDCSIRYLLAVYWLKHNMPMYTNTHRHACTASRIKTGRWDHTLFAVTKGPAPLYVSTKCWVHES